MKKNNFKKNILMMLGVLAVLVFVERAVHHMDVEPPHKVLYVISTGDETWLDIDLTYINSSGGTEQEHFYGLDTPDSAGGSDGGKQYTIEVEKASGSPVYISAQLKNEFFNRIHVAILVDGKLEQEASSKGQYSIATASGIVQ